MDDEDFNRKVVELLGPSALAGGRMSLFDVAQMFWKAGIEQARQPCPRCASLEAALRRAKSDLIEIGNRHQVWTMVDAAESRIERVLSSNA